MLKPFLILLLIILAVKADEWVKKPVKEKISILKSEYQQKGTFESLRKYFFILKDSGHIDESLSLISNYNKKHPKDEQSVLFVANNLYWNKKIPQTLSVLKEVVDETDNSDILTLYSNILNEQQRTKAVDKDTNPTQSPNTKKEEKGIEYHKNRYKKTGNLNSAKEIGDYYFLKNRARDGVKYYESYLAKNPKDSISRFRYASGLDKLKLYEKSELEYAKVLLEDSEIYDITLYRFANSQMMQNDEKKWENAKDIFTKLKAKLELQAPSKDRDDLLKYTNMSLKHIRKPMPKPTMHKDIILTEGKQKIYTKEGTLKGTKIKLRNVLSVKSMLKPPKTKEKDFLDRSVSLNGYMLQDDTIRSSSYGLRVNNVAQIDKGLLSLEVKTSNFKDGSEHTNIGVLAHYNYEDVTASLGLNLFEHFSDPIIQVLYNKPISIHDLTFGFKYINGAFINYRAKMIDHKIGALQLSLYDALLLPNLEVAEISLSLNRFDDKNINLNSWVSYPISKIVNNNFENTLAFSGSYATNSKTSKFYYSPDFYDSNYLQIKPRLYFSNNSFIQGMGGIGYSIKNSDFLYTYGLLAQVPIYESFYLNVDCRHYKSGYSQKGADECYASVSHSW